MPTGGIIVKNGELLLLSPICPPLFGGVKCKKILNFGF